MDTVYTSADLEVALAPVRGAGRRIGFVPTLGHLHAAHQRLVRRARDVSDFVVASIFVNPMQFGEGEDYSSYPRTPEEDARRLDEAGCELLFAPEVSELYPQGSEGTTVVEVPQISHILCGEYRPIHFRGVATVVTILFNIVRPDVAVFGEKDFQQLKVIRRLVRDLHIPVQIDAAPTAREPDGLAISSRNAYLTAEERTRAPALHRALQEVRETVRAGARDFPAVEARAMQRLGEAGFRPEYVSVRRASDLQPPGEGDAALVVLAAAWLGRARLIDNLPIDPPPAR